MVIKLGALGSGRNQGFITHKAQAPKCANRPGNQQRRGDGEPHKPLVAPRHSIICRDQPGLGKDHAIHKPLEEIAARLPGATANRLTANAKGPRHAHHQPVNRGAFLRAGGKVNPAQKLAITEFVFLKHVAQKLVRHALKRGNLLGKARNQSAPLGVGLLLEPL